jgi:transcriptional regulator with XRE-family HTH domain
VTEPSRKNPLGPTGVVAARRVHELREAHGWTFKELADRLENVKRPIPPLGLRRIEAEDRRIDADDLVALAVVLKVNPSALLLPTEAHGDIEVTGAGEVAFKAAWDWADGRQPLPGEPDNDGEREDEFLQLARPRHLGGPNIETKAGRQRFARQVETVPGWSVRWSPDGEVEEISRTAANGQNVLFWPAKAESS